MNWDLPSPFIIEASVAAADLDELQHTNNLVYVGWCERVAWEHSNSLGLDAGKYQELDRGMAITRSEFDYLRACGEGDKVQIATWITHCDMRLTMERRFQVVLASSGETLLRARMDFACIQLSNGKPRRLPPEFLEGYGPAVVDASGLKPETRES